jgi:cellulose synthase operon protein C
MLILLPLFLLCLFTASCTESPEQTYQRLEKTGNEYFAANNYQLALETWQKMAPMKPSTPTLHEKIGDTYFKLARYSNAIQAYNETLILQPKNGPTRFKIAKIQLLLKDIYSAEENWAQVKSHINTVDSLVFYGDLLFLKKEYTEAEREYIKAVTTHPQSQTALIRQALCFLALNKTEAADKTFNILKTLNPKSPDILIQMSNFCSLENKHHQAEIYIKKAIAFDPEDLNLHVTHANTLIGNSKYQQAILVLQHLRQKSPANRYIKKLLIDSLLLANLDNDAKTFLDTLTPAEEQDLDFNLLKGKYFLKNRIYHAAISQFQMVLEHEPKLPLAHYYLGLAYLAGGQSKLGEKSLIKSLTLNPDFGEAELTLADSYYKNSNYDLALKHAERIKKQQPENYRAHLIAGNTHLALKEYEKALRNYRKTELLYPEFSIPLYYKATIFELLEDTEKALQTYENLLQKNPKLTDAMLQYTRILSNKSKNNHAIEFLQKAINNQPTNNYLQYILGEAYLNAGSNNEAINAFNKNLSRQPVMQITYTKLFDLYTEHTGKLENILNKAISDDINFREATSKLAKIYFENKQTARAISSLEQAVAANPKSPQLANNLAWLYIEHQPEDIDEAMRLAQIAYEQFPDNPAIADTLGWIYFKKDMPTRAMWLLEQAKNLAPDNKNILGHLKTIKETL